MPGSLVFLPTVGFRLSACDIHINCPIIFVSMRWRRRQPKADSRGRQPRPTAEADSRGRQPKADAR